MLNQYNLNFLIQTESKKVIKAYSPQLRLNYGTANPIIFFKYFLTVKRNRKLEISVKQDGKLEICEIASASDLLLLRV